MSVYSWLRPLLFSIPAETAHHMAVKALQFGVVPAARTFDYPALHSTVWGLSFPNPVGLAAGFDKNAKAIAPLLQQGFGFVEVGTVTPKPQAGNPKPRLFRLPSDHAVINRMGFNNEGVDTCVDRLKHRPFQGIVGVNIGKNKTTEAALDDYILMLQTVYGLSDYIVVNISSPNTPGLRDLQHPDTLRAFLEMLMHTREVLTQQHHKRIPMLLKIDPDGTPKQREDVADIVLATRIEGLIISNTTVQRPEQLTHPHRQEMGGLSGTPLRKLSLRAIKEMYCYTRGTVPIIGVGGIASGADAYAAIKAGASLVQLYSALIYHGFGLVPRIVRELNHLLMQDGVANMSQMIGVGAK